MSQEFESRRKQLDLASWMNQSPNPLPIFRKGQRINVYRGAGWSAGVVIESSRNGCSVKLNQSGQMVRVYDARCLKPLTSAE
jgi:hypothetical protein